MQTEAMQIFAKHYADYLFLAALCGLKGLAFERAEDKHKAQPYLVWGASCIAGLEACALGLETLIPDPGLFPNGNMGMPIALMHWRNAMLATKDSKVLHANLLLIERQLADGRDYLQGPRSGFADVCAFSWAASLFETNAKDHLGPWANRMNAYAKSPGNSSCPGLSEDLIDDPVLTLHHNEADGRLTLTSTFQ